MHLVTVIYIPSIAPVTLTWWYWPWYSTDVHGYRKWSF